MRSQKTVQRSADGAALRSVEQISRRLSQQRRRVHVLGGDPLGHEQMEHRVLPAATQPGVRAGEVGVQKDQT